MVLCEIKKFDNKCRIQIPSLFVQEAGGAPCSFAYIMFDEATDEIKIKIKKEEMNRAEGVPHPSTRRAVCSKCGVEGLVGRELCVHNLTEILCHECHLKQHETKERDRP